MGKLTDGIQFVRLCKNVEKSRRQERWPRIRTQRNHFNCFEKHILPFHFRCLWWCFVKIHIFMWKNHNKILSEWKWINLAGFSFGTNFEVRVFIHRVMQIPDRLSRVLTKCGLLNRFIFYVFIRLLRTLHWISEINENPKLMKTHSFERQMWRHDVGEWTIATLWLYYKEIGRAVCLLF